MLLRYAVRGFLNPNDYENYIDLAYCATMDEAIDEMEIQMDDERVTCMFASICVYEVA